MAAAALLGNFFAENVVSLVKFVFVCQFTWNRNWLFVLFVVFKVTICY